MQTHLKMHVHTKPPRGWKCRQEERWESISLKATEDAAGMCRHPCVLPTDTRSRAHMDSLTKLYIA